MSAFALLVGINTSIACYPVGLKNWEINAGVKNFNSIMKQKKHDEILLFAKTLSNTIEDLNSKALIDSNISHDELFSKWCVERIQWRERSNQKPS